MLVAFCSFVPDEYSSSLTFSNEHFLTKSIDQWNLEYNAPTIALSNIYFLTILCRIKIILYKDPNLLKKPLFSNKKNFYL